MAYKPSACEVRLAELLLPDIKVFSRGSDKLICRETVPDRAFRQRNLLNKGSQVLDAVEQTPKSGVSLKHPSRHPRRTLLLDDAWSGLFASSGYKA